MRFINHHKPLPTIFHHHVASVTTIVLLIRPYYILLLSIVNHHQHHHELQPTIIKHSSPFLPMIFNHYQPSLTILNQAFHPSLPSLATNDHEPPMLHPGAACAQAGVTGRQSRAPSGTGLSPSRCCSVSTSTWLGVKLWGCMVSHG